MKKNSYIIAAILIHICFGKLAAAESVQLPGGKLIGTLVSDESPIAVFKGIPYGLPPVGNLRWKHALPAAPWRGERLATQSSPACMQPEIPDVKSMFYHPKPQMSEDCLYLNVWAPRASGVSSDKRASGGLPVMVWIHGGSFIEGSGSIPLYDGTELAKKDVVVVTLNYRLNIFGFFSLPELTRDSPHHASGNYGLTDQILALKWVRDNISAFGGDPGNVTLFGESAGALSVTHLLVSPLSSGLFHKAIAQSSGLHPNPKLDVTSFGSLSAHQAGLNRTRSLGELSLAELRDIPANTLLDTIEKEGSFTETIEDGWVIPMQVSTMLEKGLQHDVPLLIGFTSGEGYHLKDYVGVYTAPLPSSEGSYISDVKNRYGHIANEYLKQYPPNNLSEAVFAPLRDGIFGWASEKFAREHEKLTSNAYLYYFDHSLEWAEEKGLGAFHASEIIFMFNNIHKNVKYSPNWPDFKPRRSDIDLADKMSDYWVEFARTGKPNVKGLPEWQPYSKIQQHYMAFRNGRAEPGLDLLPGMFELHEKIVALRKSRNEAWWPYNIGLMAPVLSKSAGGVGKGVIYGEPRD